MQQAVHAAIAQGVDIISMSWTIESTESNEDGIKKLKAAVEEAADKNILMFCAASDQGVSADTSFPGKTALCFKIGAATTWGTPLKSTGTSNKHFDYIFPGQNIAQERGGEQRLNPLTGSSVATAFASGLAALILRCVQFAAHHLSQEENMDSARRNYRKAEEMKKSLVALRTRERMQEAFEQFMPAWINNTKYVEVWNIFESAGTKIEDQDPQEMQEWILKIAERLVIREKL